MRKQNYTYALKVAKLPFNPIKSLKRKTAGLSQKLSSFLNKRPLTSFFIGLGLLLAAILLSNFVFSKKPEEKAEKEIPQKVSVFTIGEVPKITMMGSVEKSGVIKITAQAPGVVQSINFLEGDYVEKGSILANLSSNYNGGNAPSLSRQLAAVQYENVRSTYEAQKEIIKKQREIAEKSETQADELRNISNESIGRTNEIIDLNSSVLDSINNQLNNNPDNQTKQTLQGLKSQYLSANNQLRSALRTTEATTPNDSEAAQISNLQKEITLKNLEIQEKGLNLSKESARLQLALAQVNEASMFPASPFSGRIERVHVKVGEAVNPGTVLFTIAGNSSTSNVYIKVNTQTAKSISKLEPSIVYINDEKLNLYPDFISNEPTDGNLHVIHFFIPEDISQKLTNNSFVKVELPIGYPDTSSSIPFVPMDSIFQGQNEAFIYIYKNGEAESKKVELGSVFGRFVEVKKGLNLKDEVILSRNIISGQKVKKGG